MAVPSLPCLGRRYPLDGVDAGTPRGPWSDGMVEVV